MPDTLSFDAAGPQLLDAVPSWWATDDPASEVAILLNSVGNLIDLVSADLDLTYTSRSLATATAEDLSAQYGLVYGVEHEQLPPTVGALRLYMQAAAAATGSTPSLVTVLTVLLTATAANLIGGPVLTFDAGGAGLTFAANGTGLTMFQFAAGEQLTSGMVFPSSGAGLIFPSYPSVGLAGGGTTPIADGITPGGAGPGLTFALNGLLTILEQTPTAFSFTVQPKSWLTFDRAAFARAIARLQPAHLLAARITEVP